MYLRILGQLDQLQQVLRNSLWVFGPLRVRSVPRAGDVIVKTSVQVGLDLVQGAHYTEGRWQFHSEAYLEDNGRS